MLVGFPFDSQMEKYLNSYDEESQLLRPQKLKNLKGIRFF